VFAEDEAAILTTTATTPAELEALTARRIAGEPLEHVVGWVEFDGLRLSVGPGVFVPRRRTGLIVREAAALLADRATVVDLCCGCGAIGAAIARRVPGVALYACDIDPVMTDYARANLLGRGQVFDGALYDALPPDLRGRVDLITANAPHVPTDAIALMPPEARDHEPAASLDGGADGLDVHRRIAAAAPSWLAPGGHLLVEVGAAQVTAALTIFAAAGLTARVVHDDDLDATVVVGTLR
jgi:release factor glutamine methyltransferase